MLTSCNIYTVLNIADDIKFAANSFDVHEEDGFIDITLVRSGDLRQILRIRKYYEYKVRLLRLRTEEKEMA